MKKQFDIITFGGATQDIMYYTKEGVIIKNKKNILAPELLAFEYGEKINSDDVHMTFGGGAMNTAVSFANLGFKTGIFTNLGDDRFSDAIVRELKSKKIDITNITKSTKTHSGFSFIINFNNENHNEHILFTHRGANSLLNISGKKLENINSQWFYIASLGGAKKLFTKNINTIFEIAEKKNIKIAWNPGVPQIKLGYKFFKKYFKNIEVFCLNKSESIDMVKTYGIKTDNVEKLLKTIHSWEVKICVITCGRLGAYVYDGNKIYFEKATKHKSTDTTGAGDAFNSSFVAGLMIYNNDIKKSLKLSMLRSGNVVSNIGAQSGLLTKNQIKP
ncbi:MAG TPA: PfkB family carbohydrate kinase [bacterium]|jgi:sugar/nucleoside kinase (ribokinase family)|nr:PfkB family carbohydrate kinase [bacterium]HOG37839.1 PfkB family carbohydrate kinase [bacterium]HQI03056.1 PfkB family carbohydrate kinase [bacterium]